MILRRALHAVDANGSKVLVLLEDERPAFGELENGQKGGNHLLGRGVPIQKLAKRRMGA